MPYDFNPRPPRGILWACAVIWILATAVMLGMGIDGFYENHRFATESEHTKGRVDDRYQQAYMGRYGSMLYQHSLSYSYVVGGVRYASGTKMVAGTTWSDYNAHAALPIVYLRDSPGDSRPDLPEEAWIYRVVPIALVFIGSVSLLAGISAAANFNSDRRDTPGAGGNPSSRA